MYPELAGSGDNHVYRVPKEPSSSARRLKPGERYIQIAAASWFVYKTDDWFSDYTASGTLGMTVADENYHAALGTFDVAEDLQIAPVFDRDVLPQRQYRGGPIRFEVTLGALRRDTALAAIFKRAADASLGVIAGMVETATLVGPAAILGKAGESIVGGVRSAITETGKDRQTFLGIEKTIYPDKLVDEETYLLVHRGSELDESQLSVGDSQGAVVPIYDGAPLKDGAWLLVRLSSSTEYQGVRPWSRDLDALAAEIEQLPQDVAMGAITKDDAKQRLQPSTAGNTLWDRFAALRTIILADGALSTTDAKKHVARLQTIIGAALRQIEQPAGSFKADVERALALPENEMDLAVRDAMREVETVRAAHYF